MPTPTPQPDTDIQTDAPDFHSIQFPSGSVLGLPSSMSDTLKNSISQKFHSLETQAGQAVGALSESMGGPSSMSDASGYLSRSGTAITHPIDALKQVGKSLTGTVTNFSDPSYLDAAHQAYSEGNHVEAATHVANWLLGPIGKVNAQSTEDLRHGDYGKAIGHVSSVLLPMLFGQPEAAPMTEADAATQAAKSSTINPIERVTPTTRPAIEPHQGWGRQPVGTSHINLPTDAGKYWTDITTEVPTPEVPVKAPASLTPVERSAVAFTRKQYAGERTPNITPEVVKQANVADTASTSAIQDFVNRAYGKGAKSAIESEKPSAVVTSAAKHADLNASAVSYLSKLEKDASPDEATILADIKARLGIRPPSAESASTASAAPSSAEIQAVKAKLGAKPSSYTYSKTEGDVSTAHRVQVLDASNKPMGYVSALEDVSEPNVLRIDASDMGEHASKGYGTKAYQKLANEAAKQGKTLASGGVVSDSAAGVWRKLKASGLNVIEHKTPAGSTFEIPAPTKIDTTVPITKTQAASDASRKFFLPEVTKKVQRLMPHEEDLPTSDWQ